jgi:hypothetical protein
MVRIPSREKITNGLTWNSGAGSAFLGGPVEHHTALGPLAACKSPLLQIPVAAIRGGAIPELSSGNQPRVANRHRDGDGDGPVRVDQSSVEKRTEQGRLSGGCAQ